MSDEKTTEQQEQQPERFQIPAHLRAAAKASLAQAGEVADPEALLEKLRSESPDEDPAETVGVDVSGLTATIEVPDEAAPAVAQAVTNIVEEQPPVPDVVDEEFESFDGPAPEVTTVQPEAKVEIVEKPKIQVDLTNLDILSHATALARNSAIDNTLRRKSTFMVVCPQSAYTAKMSALCMEDKIRIQNSVDTPFENRRHLYKMVYDHIEQMNIPKPKFDDWLRMTSYHDVETLLYGLYSQTYPGESDFDITCGRCENKVEAKIGAHLLQQVKDQEAYKHLDTVVNTDNPADVNAASMVHTTSRVMVYESSIVFDIVTPSAADHLQLLRAFNPKFIQDITGIVGMMLFVKQAFIPDQSSLESGHPKFYPVNDRNEILKTISKLSPKDGDRLDKEINDRAKKYEINYNLPKMTCASCGNEIKEISIDIENVLFSNIAGKM